VREEGHRERRREHAPSDEPEDRDDAGGAAEGVFVVAHTRIRRSSSTAAAPGACFFWGISLLDVAVELDAGVGLDLDALATQLGRHGLLLDPLLLAHDHALAHDEPLRHDELLFEDRDRHRPVWERLDEP